MKMSVFKVSFSFYIKNVKCQGRPIYWNSFSAQPLWERDSSGQGVSDSGFKPLKELWPLPSPLHNGRDLDAVWTIITQNICRLVLLPFHFAARSNSEVLEFSLPPWYKDIFESAACTLKPANKINNNKAVHNLVDTTRSAAESMVILDAVFPPEFEKSHFVCR